MTRYLKLDEKLDTAVGKLASQEKRTIHNMLLVLLAEAVARRNGKEPK